MAGTKRTRASGKAATISSEYVSDDGFVASDCDIPASKKTKAATGKASTSNASTSNSASNSKVFHDLSTGHQPRRVNVSEFKGKKLVNIREYYEKDGEMLPGKKVPNQPNLTDLTKQLGMLRDCLQGISLNAEQFTELLRALPDIKRALNIDDDMEVEDPKQQGDEAEVDGEKLTKMEKTEARLLRKHPDTFPIEANGTLYFVQEMVRNDLQEYEGRLEQFVKDFEVNVTKYDPKLDGPRENYEVEADYKELDNNGEELSRSIEEKKEKKSAKKEKEEPVVDGVKLTRKEIDIIKKTRKHPNYILMEKKGRGMLPL